MKRIKEEFHLSPPEYRVPYEDFAKGREVISTNDGYMWDAMERICRESQKYHDNDDWLYEKN
jgi:hypothetical protein